MCEPETVTGATARSHWTINRRQALRLAAAAGVVAIPTVAGGRLLLESNGRPNPQAPVYVTADGAEEAPSPVLLAYTDNANPYIWAEMLRVEGTPYVDVLRLTELDQSHLRTAAALMLAPGEVTNDQLQLVRSYVEEGGGLIVVMPDTRLAPLCGLSWREEWTDDGYLCVRRGAIGGDGIASGALQFHAPLRHYQMQEAEAVAYLCNRDGVPAQTPAVTYRRLGRGAIATWCYDLAQSIVFTRQGPPAHAGAETDGVDGIRAVDMFVGFVDLDRLQIPQADEQQRLWVNLLNEVSIAPLPRLWYFPHDVASLLVATGDSHNNPAPDVDAVLRRVERYGGSMSIYYTPPPTDTARRAARRVRAWLNQQPVIDNLMPPSDVVTPYHAEQWRARGHEFALHPYVEEGLEAGWARYWQQFTGLGYGAFETTRTHRVLWNGWTETARVQSSYAVRMNLDYYHVGPTFQRPDGSWAFGYFTGSGLPMRFVDEEGRLIDNWQQNTHLVDEQLIEMPWGANFVGATPEQAVEIADSVIQRAAAGAYAALGAQFHFDPFAVPGPWTAGAESYLDGVLASCQVHGLPIVASAHWLDFTRARASVRFSAFQFDATSGVLTFTAHTDSPDAGLNLLLPVQNRIYHLAVLQANRKQIAYKTRKVGATLYAIAQLDATELAFEARYQSA